MSHFWSCHAVAYVFRTRMSACSNDISAASIIAESLDVSWTISNCPVLMTHTAKNRNKMYKAHSLAQRQQQNYNYYNLTWMIIIAVSSKIIRKLYLNVLRCLPCKEVIHNVRSFLQIRSLVQFIIINGKMLKSTYLISMSLVFCKRRFLSILFECLDHRLRSATW